MARDRRSFSWASAMKHSDDTPTNKIYCRAPRAAHERSSSWTCRHRALSLTSSPSTGVLGTALSDEFNPWAYYWVWTFWFGLLETGDEIHLDKGPNEVVLGEGMLMGSGRTTQVICATHNLFIFQISSDQRKSGGAR